MGLPGRISSPWLLKAYMLLFAVIVIASGVLIYLLLLRNVFGYFTMDGQGFLDEDPARVAVLDSKHSRDYLAKTDLPMGESLAEVWAQWLADAGASVVKISDSELESWTASRSAGFDALVLPAAISLTALERERIDEYLAAGGGVVASWYTGARDEKGEWVGYEMIERFSNGRITDSPSLPDGVKPWFVSTSGHSPVTAGIPEGTILGALDGKLALAAYNVDWADGYYTDRARQFVDLEPEADRGPYSFALHTSAGDGRFVWFGMPLTAFHTKEQTANVPARLATNAVDWVARRPVAAIDTWPEGRRSAVIFAQDTESFYQASEETQRIFTELDVPVTFFCVSDLARDHEALTTRLAAVGEIGSHSDDHSPLGGVQYEKQLARITRTKADLEEITGQACVGFRPPEEKYDEETIRALAHAGYRYMVGGFEASSAVPAIHTIARGGTAWKRSKSNRIVEIPRVGVDDYELLVTQDLKDPRAVIEAYKTSFLAHYRMGTIYFLSFHTHLLTKQGVEDVIPKLVNYMRSKRVWIATGGDVANWWEARDGVRFRTEVLGPNRLGLYVSSEYDKPIPAINLRTYLPRSPGKITVTPSVIGFNAPSYTYERENDALVLNVEELRPFESRSFLVDFH